MARARRKKPAESPEDRAEADRQLENIMARSRLRQAARSEENDIQTSLRLSRALYDTLIAAGQEHGVGVGEEIRRRLDSTFALALDDPETGELASAIVQAAHQIDRAYGRW